MPAAFNTARDQVVPFLITADWLQGEADDQGVKMTPTPRSPSMLKTIEAQRFPTAPQLQSSSSQSGETNADLLFRVRIDTLSNKLAHEGHERQGHGHAGRHPGLLQQEPDPLRHSPRRATCASCSSRRRPWPSTLAALLRAGQSLTKVAKKYSIDPATKARAARCSGSRTASEEHALNRPIFAAKVGQLVGPVKTPFGYYVFRVEKITPATQQTLAQGDAR